MKIPDLFQMLLSCADHLLSSSDGNAAADKRSQRNCREVAALNKHQRRQEGAGW